MPAVSQAQQRFMGMVRAYQKGKLKNAPKSVRKAAHSMSAKAAKEFAHTKRKGLPETVGESVLDQTLDQLYQEMDDLEAEHEEATLVGEDPEVLDEIEAEIERLQSVIDQKQHRMEGYVNVAETFKSLSFKQFLGLDEAVVSGPPTAGEQQAYELQALVAELANVLQLQMQSRQATSMSRADAQIRKAVSLGAPMKEGLLGGTYRAARDYIAQRGEATPIGRFGQFIASNMARPRGGNALSPEAKQRAKEISAVSVPLAKRELAKKRGPFGKPVVKSQQNKAKTGAAAAGESLRLAQNIVARMQQIPGGQKIVQVALQRLKNPAVAQQITSLLRRARKTTMSSAPQGVPQ